MKSGIADSGEITSVPLVNFIYPLCPVFRSQVAGDGTMMIYSTRGHAYFRSVERPKRKHDREKEDEEDESRTERKRTG